MHTLRYLFNKSNRNITIKLFNMKKQYLPTYYEIVTELNKYEDHNFDGRGGRWEMAEKLTYEFEETHKHTDWTDNEVDWFTAIENFVHDII